MGHRGLYWRKRRDIIASFGGGDKIWRDFFSSSENIKLGVEAKDRFPGDHHALDYRNDEHGLSPHTEENGEISSLSFLETKMDRYPRHARDGEFVDDLYQHSLLLWQYCHERGSRVTENNCGQLP